jgi:hypothetical protein
MLCRVTDGSHAGATILVVDDEPQLLRLMVRVLEREQHKVLSARDGEEAVALFDQHRDEIDAVILDVIIPPDGARPVLAQLRERNPGLRLLLSSGDELDAGLRSEMEALGGRFLRKPYVPSTLLEILGELLSS